MAASGVTGPTLSITLPSLHPYQQPQTPHILKMPFLAPLLATAGRAIASQGLKGAMKQGAKKVAQSATKEGLKDMAMEGAKNLGEKVTSGEAMESAMGKLKERQQQKEAERRQRSNELMEAGRQRASSGSTTMGA